MAPPNKIQLPANLDRELGDLRRQLRALQTQGSTSLPGPYNESVDAGHPMDLDIPLSNGVKVTLAKLSCKFKPYRSTSSSAGGNTGSAAGTGTGSSGSHGHTEAGHTHHNTPTVGGPGAFTLSNGSGLQVAAGPVTGWDTDSGNGSGTGSAGSHTHTEDPHVHSVGGSSLGVSEGSTSSITALAVDGVDKTSILGGPWASDFVDLDLLSVIPMGDGAWHKITLTTAGQGRVVAVLKISA